MRIEARYELAAELGPRYWEAGRKQRGEILDVFCVAAGYDRKHAIKVLRGKQKRKAALGIRRQRQKRYGLEFRKALRVAWEAAGYISTGQLGLFRPELVPCSSATVTSTSMRLTTSCC